MLHFDMLVLCTFLLSVELGSINNDIELKSWDRKDILSVEWTGIPFYFRRPVREKRTARKEGEEGYDPYDFEEDEASADESKCHNKLIPCLHRNIYSLFI